MIDAGNERQEANLVQNKEGKLSGPEKRDFFAKCLAFVNNRG